MPLHCFVRMRPSSISTLPLTTPSPHHTQDNDKLKLTDPTVAVLLVAALLQAVQLLALGPMVNEAMRKRNRKEKEEGFADVSRWVVLDGIAVALSLTPAVIDVRA